MEKILKQVTNLWGGVTPHPELGGPIFYYREDRGNNAILISTGQKTKARIDDHEVFGSMSGLGRLISQAQETIYREFSQREVKIRASKDAADRLENYFKNEGLSLETPPPSFWQRTVGNLKGILFHK